MTLKTMFVCYIITNSIAGWGSSAARRAHIPKVAGSNPAPATRYPVCHDFRGMRIRVSDVLDLLEPGLSQAAILDEMPDLEQDDIRAFIQFARRQRISRSLLSQTSGRLHSGRCQRFEPPINSSSKSNLASGRVNANNISWSEESVESTVSKSFSILFADKLVLLSELTAVKDCSEYLPSIISSCLM